jgi:hypothetical protein
LSYKFSFRQGAPKFFQIPCRFDRRIFTGLPTPFEGSEMRPCLTTLTSRRRAGASGSQRAPRHRALYRPGGLFVRAEVATGAGGAPATPGHHEGLARHQGSCWPDESDRSIAVRRTVRQFKQERSSPYHLSQKHLGNPIHSRALLPGRQIRFGSNSDGGGSMRPRSLSGAPGLSFRRSSHHFE